MLRLDGDWVVITVLIEGPVPGDTRRRPGSQHRRAARCRSVRLFSPVTDGYIAHIPDTTSLGLP